MSRCEPAYPVRSCVELALTVLLAAGTAVTMLAPPAQAQSPDRGVAGNTTLEQTIRGGDRSDGFAALSLGPGEPHVVREDDLGKAIRGRERRRQSLLYFGVLNDSQIVDEESPARVEFLDQTADFPPSPFGGAWGPDEPFGPHKLEAATRQLNYFVDRSPVPQARDARARMELVVMPGDLVDNQQLNETRSFLEALEGGTIDPNSGSSDPAAYADCPPGTPGPAEAARYTGVQDYDDYYRASQFYDPDEPIGPWERFPRYPGLVDRAQEPFRAHGLRAPSYAAFGNHDGLAQGNAAAIAPYEAVGTGCIKPLIPEQSLSAGLELLDPATVAELAEDPQRAMLVPPDERRQYLTKEEYKALNAGGEQSDAHGFAYVDPEEERASNGAAGYYAWSPRPGLRLISLDTLSEGGIPGPSAQGNLDQPQFRWLEQELQAASRRDELIIAFGHHSIGTLVSPVTDEAAPPCTGIEDRHGHDVNPGCDADPRSSEPVHLGTDLVELFHRYPHVIAYVAGHTHTNEVTPFPRSGGGGFWQVETAAVVDYPMQTRLVEVMDNRDRTLSIFGTMLDIAAPVEPPASGTDASGFGVEELASIARVVGYNDPQRTDGAGTGEREDRNVELLIDDPRAPGK